MNSEAGRGGRDHEIQHGNIVKLFVPIYFVYLSISTTVDAKNSRVSQCGFHIILSYFNLLCV